MNYNFSLVSTQDLFAYLKFAITELQQRIISLEDFLYE